MADNIVIPDELRQTAPLREDYYNTMWEAEGQLSVTASDDVFFLKPGEQITFSATRQLADGTSELLDASSGVTFELLSNTDHATITANGVLSINSVASAFSSYSEADVVLVVARTNDQFGIGQAMIIDDDTDGDTLLDSYEDAAGLDKLVVTNAYEEVNGTVIFETAANYGQTTVPLIDPLPVTQPADNNPDIIDDETGETDASGGTANSAGGGGGTVSLWTILILLMYCVPISRKAKSSNRV